MSNIEFLEPKSQIRSYFYWRYQLKSEIWPKYFFLFDRAAEISTSMRSGRAALTSLSSKTFNLIGRANHGAKSCLFMPIFEYFPASPIFIMSVIN